MRAASPPLPRIFSTYGKGGGGPSPLDNCLPSSDYTSVADYPLTFSAGNPVGISRCANIDIIDDLVVEPDQYFSVSLASADPVYVTPTSLAQVIIADNDCELLMVPLCLCLSLSLSLSLSLPSGMILSSHP